MNQSDNVFASIIENKRIVVVGRAPYLLNNLYMDNQAEFIDAHDIVVRVNKPAAYTDDLFQWGNDSGCFIDPNYTGVLGKRTDVFFVKSRLFYNHHKWLDAFVKDGGKVVCHNRHSKSPEYHPCLNAISESCYTHQIPDELVGEYKRLFGLIGGVKTTIDKTGNEKTRTMRVTTAHQIIADILSYNVKQVSLIGFTQWSSDHPQDKIDYESTLRHPSHSADHGLLLLRIMMEQDSRVKPDDMLLSLFEEKKGMLDERQQQFEDRKTAVKERIEMRIEKKKIRKKRREDKRRGIINK